MGLCPLSPEHRVTKKKNNGLRKIMADLLLGMELYNFVPSTCRTAYGMPSRYLLTEAILEDIEILHAVGRASVSKSLAASFSEQIEQQLQNSCLILEDNTPKEQEQNEDDLDSSFQCNLKKNESLVVQINILYRQEIKKSQYSEALSMFLKWAQMFQDHFGGGFLRPILKNFCQSLYKLPLTDFNTLIDETCVFVQYMVKVVIEVYKLKNLATYDNGKLFKNQNVYNLVMSFLFKRTRINKFLLASVRTNFEEKIKLFSAKLEQHHMKGILFFGVDAAFALNETKTEEKHDEQMTSSSNASFPPYYRSLKLMEDLSKFGTPVNKLKVIVAISKQIIREITQYYQRIEKKIPDMDAQNLMGIIMYLIVHTNNPKIFEELKIVENFSTSNCLNCISGYYLNSFLAAIEASLQLK